MRVKCDTVESFMANLNHTSAIGVVGGAIRYKTDRKLRKEGSCTYDVFFQISCVVAIEEGEYILEAIEYCGRDYEDSTGEMSGSARAKDLMALCLDYVSGKECCMLPGSVDY